MTLNNDLIKKVRSFFGLNSYEAKVWLALLAKGIASAGEISEISGVPRSRTYDILESLEKQGYVIQKIGKPIKFIAVKPKNVLENLKKLTKKEAEERINILNNIKGTKEYEQLELLHKSSKNFIKNKEVSSAIKGENNIYSHIYELIDNANKEVLISITEEELLKKEKMYKELFNKMDKKIRLKIAVNGDKEKLKELESKFKIKFYYINIKLTFFIIDKEQVLFLLKEREENEKEIAIWLNSSFFSSSLAHLFELGIK
ncbi:MAG: helix-turn-helix domain-containing protein [Candidatus Pacearchaeota archaeon]